VPAQVLQRKTAPCLALGTITKDEAMANIKDAILTVLDMMREQGEPISNQPVEIRELIVA
jgi:predicted RNase H-like HicB family nuclease